MRSELTSRIDKFVSNGRDGHSLPISTAGQVGPRVTTPSIPDPSPTAWVGSPVMGASASGSAALSELSSAIATSAAGAVSSVRSSAS